MLERTGFYCQDSEERAVREREAEFLHLLAHLKGHNGQATARSQHAMLSPVVAGTQAFPGVRAKASRSKPLWDTGFQAAPHTAPA